MRSVIEVLVFLVVVLIAIGDGVLFGLRLLAKFLQRLFLFLQYLLQTILWSLARMLKRIDKQIPSTSLSLNKYTHDIFVQGEKQSKKHRAKKHKKSFNVFAFSLLSKIKYFLAGFIFAAFFIFFPLVFVIYVQDLPNPEELTHRQIAQTTKLYDRAGQLLYQIYANQNRTLVPLSDIPLSLQKATIAIEDKDFYNHPGFDITAIARSLLTNLKGRQLQGGSTITQQLIKSALLSPQTSITRKIKEAILAFWAERIYTKNQILELYFNQVPYGGTAWGAEAASEIYFGKAVKDLDLAQSAFLAGIPRAPTIYSPYGQTPNAWKKRQKEVLSRMVELGFINKDQSEQTLQEELHFQSPQIPINAPHFVMYVKDLLVKNYGLPMVEKGGLSVTTSLDLKLQEKVQKIVTDEVQSDEYLQISNGAALITNPKNGDILAMVGSRNFYQEGDGNVNLTTSLRQPGSSIKVITYSTAFSQGLTAATILDDSPITFSNQWESYSPVNYDGRFHGRLPLRLALANSLNVPAVKVLNQIGIPNMVATAKKMGITTWTDPSRFGLSLTLGGGEVKMLDMTTVYGVLANGGIRVDPNPILKITDSKGAVLEEKPKSKELLELGGRVLEKGVAFILSDILADNNARSMEFGINSPLNISGHYVSVKTGTTDNKRDNWTFGYTKQYVVGVWVGNNDNTPMNPSLASGITGAAPIWNKILTTLLAKTKDERPAPPEDVVQKFCSGRVEYFIRGTESSQNCGFIPNSSLTPFPTQQPTH